MINQRPNSKATRSNLIPEKNHLHILTIDSIERRKKNGMLREASKIEIEKRRKAIRFKECPEFDELFTTLDTMGIGQSVYRHLKTHESYGIKKLKRYYKQVSGSLNIFKEATSKKIFLPPPGKPGKINKETGVVKAIEIPLCFVNDHVIIKHGVENTQEKIGLRRSPLEYLELSFNENSIHSVGSYNRIIRTVSRLFMDLQSLTFDFESCIEVTDNTLKQLKITRMRELRTLNLNFTLLYELNKGNYVKQFLYGINKRLVNLEDLSLNFSRCYLVTDNVLASLGRGFKVGFQKLRSLSLSFEYCGGVTDRGLKNLFFYIKKPFPNVKHITLSFKICDNITDEGIEYLIAKRIRQYLYNLEAVTLDFRGCLDVTEQAKKSLIQELSFEGKITIY